MPELPEVHTTTLGVNKVLKGRTFLDVWTSLNSKDKRQTDTIKNPLFFKKLQKEIKGKKFLKAERVGKNILIHISESKTILIHMKMTGHLMYGKYEFDKKNNSWSPHKSEKNEKLRDPYNRFVRVVFILDNDMHLVFCDTRKFGKITILNTDDIKDSKHLNTLGIDALSKNLNSKKFGEILNERTNGKIKSVLLDQTKIAGIGNIYSDEALWLSNIHPLSIVSKIPKREMSTLYIATVKVLEKGIDFGGDSTSDYRNIYGEHGKFHHAHNVYRLKGEKCKKKNCEGVIERLVVGGRSAHFCPKHQKIFK